MKWRAYSIDLYEEISLTAKRSIIIWVHIIIIAVVANTLKRGEISGSGL